MYTYIAGSLKLIVFMKLRAIKMLKYRVPYNVQELFACAYA